MEMFRQAGRGVVGRVMGALAGTRLLASGRGRGGRRRRGWGEFGGAAIVSETLESRTLLAADFGVIKEHLVVANTPASGAVVSNVVEHNGVFYIGGHTLVTGTTKGDPLQIAITNNNGDLGTPVVTVLKSDLERATGIDRPVNRGDAYPYIEGGVLKWLLQSERTIIGVGQGIGYEILVNGTYTRIPLWFNGNGSYNEFHQSPIPLAFSGSGIGYYFGGQWNTLQVPNAGGYNVAVVTLDFAGNRWTAGVADTPSGELAPAIWKNTQYMNIVHTGEVGSFFRLTSHQGNMYGVKIAEDGVRSWLVKFNTSQATSVSYEVVAALPDNMGVADIDSNGTDLLLTINAVTLQGGPLHPLNGSTASSVYVVTPGGGTEVVQASVLTGRTDVIIHNLAVTADGLTVQGFQIGTGKVTVTSLKKPPTTTNIAPTIAGFDTLVSWTENSAAVVLDSNATVSDPDSLNFATGKLTVSLTAGAQTTDRLSIRNQGTLAGQISVVGNSVRFGSTAIGTITGTGFGSAPLIVTLNTAATPAAVQALLRNVAFASVSENPAVLNRTVQVTLADGDGGTSTPVSKSIRVVAVNDPPVVGAFDTQVTYTENAVPVVLDTNATVADVDSLNLLGGRLTVSLTANGSSTDRLSIRNQGNLTGQIGVVGNSVRFGGIAIGTFTGTTTLIVTLNTAATPAAVQALLRNVTFASVSENPAVLNRTVRVTLTDGDGGTSTAVSKSIRVVAVYDAPVVGAFDGSVSYRAGAAAVVLDTNATVADVDSLNFAGGRLTFSLSRNGQRTDVLGIRHQGTGAGQIGVSGSSIRYGSVVIGTFTGGVGVSPLVVTLSAGATPAAVQALLRNVTFRSTATAPVTLVRTASVSLTDGDGGTSVLRSKLVSVLV